MNDREISKFLSYVLRHKPETIGLTLDSQGWASVSELLAKSTVTMNAHDLESAVVNNEKQRFAMSPDGQFIRANQGHSVKIDLGLTPSAPPEILFHGTVEKFLESILAQGLQPQSRLQVHLSKDIETAQTVGARRGKPVILRIKAGEMHRAGFSFFLSQNGVWLTDSVLPNFLITPEVGDIL